MAKKKLQKWFTFNDKRYVVRADTPEELAVKEYKKRQELEGLVKTIERDMLVREWIEEWFEIYKEPAVSEETLVIYRSNFKRNILPVIGSMKMKAVKHIHCQKVLNDMHRKNYSEAYMKRVKVQLIEIFREAERNGLVLSNPAEGLVVPKGTVSESRALTDYEEYMCRQLAETHPFGIVVRIMLDCGLRIGEVAALRWCDINFDKNILSVKHTIKRLSGIGAPKTKAGLRDVPVPADLSAYLYSLRGEPFNFVVGGGTEPIRKARLYTLWHHFVNDLNILMGCENQNGKALPPFRTAPDLRPHYFRHTYCTHLQDAGVPINVARQFMGHASILVTQKIYTHNSEQSFESARRLIEQNKKNVAAETATRRL